LLSRIELKAITPNTITDRGRFRQELQTVRSRGYAVDDEETFPGVRCVASPIHDHSHQVIAAMGISGPSSRLSMERMHEYGRHVYALASEFSTLLGATNIGIQKEVIASSDHVS
jgi:IclR family transcriptional regulator, acetate operon repressor